MSHSGRYIIILVSIFHRTDNARSLRLSSTAVSWLIRRLVGIPPLSIDFKTSRPDRRVMVALDVNLLLRHIVDLHPQGHPSDGYTERQPNQRIISPPLAESETHYTLVRNVSSSFIPVQGNILS